MILGFPVQEVNRFLVMLFIFGWHAEIAVLLLKLENPVSVCVILQIVLAWVLVKYFLCILLLVQDTLPENGIGFSLGDLQMHLKGSSRGK